MAVKEKALSTVETLLKSITFRELYATFFGSDPELWPLTNNVPPCRNESDDHGDIVLHSAVSRKDWDMKANAILMLLLLDDRLDANHPNEEYAPECWPIASFRQ